MMDISGMERELRRPMLLVRARVKKETLVNEFYDWPVKRYIWQILCELYRNCIRFFISSDLDYRAINVQFENN